MSTAVVLIGHGTVESLDQLGEFLTNIRRGHAPPPELLDEVRRRYSAIGGRSPLLDHARALATKLEAELGLPARVAMRLFRPYPKEVLEGLAAEGIRRVVALPFAQFSAKIYVDAVAAAAKALTPPMEVLGAPNWGLEPELTRAFAEGIAGALAEVPASDFDATAIVFTAHSLPVAVVRSGDPYEHEFRRSVADIVAELEARGRTPEHVVAFQSQGIGTGVAWLGPDLRATLEDLAKRGKRHVVLAPIGFLADHVEVLYDLDIEARAWCEHELGLSYRRMPSLNASAGLVKALASVARAVLAQAPEGA